MILAGQLGNNTGFTFDTTMVGFSINFREMILNFIALLI